MWHMFLRATVASVFLLTAIVARADSDSTEPEPSGAVPSTPSALQFGRLLLRAGRLEHARQFLERAQPANEDEWIERLWWLGQIELGLGMPQHAAQRFETILKRHPELTRIRLELARAFYLAGRDREARSHFQASLREPLPASVEAAVEGFLRSMDARKRWSGSLSLSMLPQTKRSNQQYISVGGVPFRLNEDARAPSGIGALVSAGLSFSPVLSADRRGVFTASVASKRYERSTWNDTTVSSDLGISRLSDQGAVSGGLRIARRWSGGDPYYRSIGPWSRINRSLSDTTWLAVALSATYRKHDEQASRDGWRIVASPRFTRSVSEHTSVELETTLEQVQAREDHQGSRLIGIGATLAHAFETGLSALGSAHVQLLRHSAKDPLFAGKRSDRNLRFSLRVSHRSLRYRGFSPYIGLSMERNRSNLAIYESRSKGIFIGVTRRF